MVSAAVLARTKTKTRRVEKSVSDIIAEAECIDPTPMSIFSQMSTNNGIDATTTHGRMFFPTRYKLGEVVAVAQSYETMANGGYLVNMAIPANNAVGFTFKNEYTGRGYNNKMFVRADLMPHQVEITDVRIERLQDISDEDCLKEGILRREIRPFNTIEIKYQVPRTVIYKDNPRAAFVNLINRSGVGRKGLWAENPWVVVYGFKLVK